MRKWAKKSLQFLGSISCDDYHDLRDVVKWIINVSEFDLLRSRNLEDIDVNILPAHLFLRNHIKEYWASLCTLLKKFESKTIRLQLLSRDNHNQFVTMLLTAIDQENCQNNGMFACEAWMNTLLFKCSYSRSIRSFELHLNCNSKLIRQSKGLSPLIWVAMPHIALETLM